MGPRLTESLQTVAQASNQDATKAGQAYIGTQNFLIALVGIGTGVAADLLRSRGVDAEKIRGAITSSPDVAWAETGGELKASLARAMDEARQLNHLEMSEDHMLLGILHDPGCRASVVLARLGVDPQALRREVLGRVTPGPAGAIAARNALVARFAADPRVLELKQQIEKFQ
ncbi:MAG TPA: Clp protease N-terminal domain-containing protein, partial [Pirellulales bacterium]